MLFDSPSSFGRAFRIVTFGESHGLAVGVVMDGVKPGLPFDSGGHPEGTGPPATGPVGYGDAAE